MKKNYYLALTAMLAVFCITTLFSCKKDKPDGGDGNEPKLILEKTEILVEAAGGEASVSYSLENPPMGTRVECNSKLDWISDVIVGHNKIKFTVAPSDLDTERSGQLDVVFEGVTYPLKVRQSPGFVKVDIDFQVTYTEITETSVSLDVEPSDNENTYVVFSMDGAYYEQLGTDEERIKRIEDLIKSNAEGSVEQYLQESGVLKKGKSANLTFEGFKPQTLNYILLAGMDIHGRINSDLKTEKFTTTKPADVDITFEIDTEVDGVDLTANIRPSKSDIEYVYQEIPKAQYESYGGTDRERVQKYMDEMLSNLGFISPEEFLSSLLKKGDQTYVVKGKLTPETDYVLFAAAIHLKSGIVISEVAVKDFRTEKVKPSDNQLGLDIISTNADRVKFSVSVTNNDPYVYYVVPVSEIQGKSDDEIMQHIVKTYDLLTFVNNGKIENVSVKGLKPLTEYMLAVFGYSSGFPNTGLVSEKFTTCEAGDPTQFTYTSEVSDVTESSARIKVTPTPDNVMYYLDVCTKGARAEDIKKKLDEMIDMFVSYGIYSSRLEYLTTYSFRGADEYYIDDKLAGGTEYQVYAFAIDDKTGDYATDIIFGSTFKTLEISGAPAKPVDLLLSARIFESAGR